VFPYSDRPGTGAASMQCKVGGAIVRERGRRVREIAQQLSKTFRESQVGTTRPALTIDDGTVAVTDNYLRVPVAPGRRRNESLEVVVNYP
jgi:tRNA A37 methylthiotransferase MiaB